MILLFWSDHLIWVHYYYCYWRPSVCVIPHTACIIFVSSYYRVSFYVYRCTPTAKSYLTTEYFVLLYLQIVWWGWEPILGVAFHDIMPTPSYSGVLTWFTRWLSTLRWNNRRISSWIHNNPSSAHYLRSYGLFPSRRSTNARDLLPSQIGNSALPRTQPRSISGTKLFWVFLTAF